MTSELIKSESQLYFDMDCIDDDILESFIIELGMRQNHLVTDPKCFICRHYNNSRYDNLLYPNSRTAHTIHYKGSQAPENLS